MQGLDINSGGTIVKWADCYVERMKQLIKTNIADTDARLLLTIGMSCLSKNFRYI